MDWKRFNVHRILSIKRRDSNSAQEQKQIQVQVKDTWKNALSVHWFTLDAFLMSSPSHLGHLQAYLHFYGVLSSQGHRACSRADQNSVTKTGHAGNLVTGDSGIKKEQETWNKERRPLPVALRLSVEEALNKNQLDSILRTLHSWFLLGFYPDE